MVWYVVQRCAVTLLHLLIRAHHSPARLLFRGSTEAGRGAAGAAGSQHSLLQASKIQSAVAMQQVTKDISKVSQGLDSAMKSMDLVKVATIMADFSKQDEDIELRTTFMEQVRAPNIDVNI